MGRQVWRFFDYVSPSGNNLIERWYEDQPPEVQADFDTVLQDLSILRDWQGISEVKPLKGKQKGLFEIRFKSAGRRYRPIGYFGPGEWNFTLLVGCYKKNGNYTPHEALNTAVERRANLKHGWGGYDERPIKSLG